MAWVRTTGMRILLAMVLSLALWVFVSFSQNPDRISDPYNVPTEIQNLAPDLVVVNGTGLPRTDLPPVNVRIQSDVQTLARIRTSDLNALIDLQGLAAGEHVVPVDVVIDSPFDRRVQVESVEPPTVNIRLDQRVERTVPLRIDIEGNPPFSFERGNPLVNDLPVDEAEVLVIGPENRVNQVVIASTTANIDQLSANYESSLQLQALDANNQPVDGVEIVPATVNVEIPIRSVVGLKRVPVIATIDGLPAPGYAITNIRSEPLLINLTGSSGSLDRVEQVETAPVDIGGATTTITREVDLLIPAGTSPQFGDQRQALVTVDIEPLQRTFQLRLPFAVEVVGADAGLQVSPNPAVVSVELAGSAEAFARMDDVAVAATVDVSGLGPGVYELTPTINVPDGLSTTRVSPVRVVIQTRVRPTLALPLPTAVPEVPSETIPPATESMPTPLPLPSPDASEAEATLEPDPTRNPDPLPDATESPASGLVVTTPPPVEPEPELPEPTIEPQPAPGDVEPRPVPGG